MRFKRLYDTQGWEVAGREYEVSEKLEKLIEIAKIANERKISPNQLADAAVLAETLKRNDIEAQPIVLNFADTVLKLGRQMDWNHEKTMSQCAELIRITRTYGNFDDIKPEYEQLGKEIAGRRKEFESLDDQVLKKKKNLADLNQTYSIKENTIRRYSNVQVELKKMGLDVEVHPELTLNVLKNLEPYRFKIKFVLADLKRKESLESQLSNLNSKLHEVSKQMKDTETDLDKVNSELVQKRATLELVNLLDGTGITAPMIKKVRDIIVKISAKYGIQAGAAMDRLQKDLLKNYDPSLSLNLQVERLDGERKRLTDQNNEIRAKNKLELSKERTRLAEIISEQKKKEKELRSYISIVRKGGSDSVILGLGRLIKGTSLDRVWSRVKEISELDDLKEEKRREVELIEEEKSRLSAELDIIRRKKRVVESEISELTKAGISKIKKTSSSAINALDIVADTTSSSINSAIEDFTGRTTELSNHVSTIDQEVLGRKGSVGRNLTEIDRRTGELGEIIVTRVNSLESRAFAIGKDLGKLEALAPIAEFIEKGTGDESQILFAISLICLKLRDYAKGKMLGIMLEQAAMNLYEAIESARR